MLLTPMDVDACERLRADLEALDGVRRAIVDPDPLRVFVVAERTDAPTEMLVRSILAREGIAASDAEVHLSHLPAPEPRRRVRFLSAAVESPRVGTSVARVELEWSGRVFRGEAEGESGGPIEMRLVALATLRAIEDILADRLTFTLVGVKAMRAFDADVVVVLLRAPGSSQLVGTALASHETTRAAALAVLNATNRLLGNYLSNAEAE